MLRRATGVATAAVLVIGSLVSAASASAAGAVVQPGQPVLYATDTYTSDGTFQLAQMNATGTSTQLTTDAGDHLSGVYSPDRGQVVYSGNAGNASTDDHDLWVISSAGGTPTKLTSGTTTDDGDPAWSPDGNWIAFDRGPVDGSAPPSIYVMPAGGGTPVKIGSSSADVLPSWSPNGRLIALTHVTSAGLSIVVTTKDGRYRRTVSGTSSADFDSYASSWSPDGTQLSFIHSDATADRLATISAAGGTPNLLTDTTLNVGAQSWAQDGSGKIVYDAYNDTTDGLFVISSDGSGSPGEITSDETRVYDSPVLGNAAAAYTPAPPAAPASVSASLASGSVKLSWPAVSGATYYVVQRSAADGAAPATPEDGVTVYAGAAATTTATGLTNGSAYQFSVFAMNYRGDNSAPTSRGARPAAAPVVTPNGSVLGSFVGNGPKFTIRWGKTLPAGQSYDVQVGSRTFSGGKWSAVSWKALVSATTTTSKDVTPTAGNTYYIRALVRDDFGNTTQWTPSAVAPVPYDDRAFSMTGSWLNQTGLSGRFLGTIRQGTAAGARLTYSAYGTKFSIVADKCVKCGQMKVYFDGVLKGTVDTHASTTLTKQAVWNSGTYDLTKKHTIIIIVVGTSGRPQVRIDGLIARR